VHNLEQKGMAGRNNKPFNTEKEIYWRSIKKVQLEEKFLLFDTARNGTQIRHSDYGAFESLKSSIRLETGLLNVLNISIATAPYVRERYYVLTPFQREHGYPLDKDDLAFASRLAKINKRKLELAEAVEGLYLFAFVAYEDMAYNGSLQALVQEDGRTVKKEIATHHLFLTLAFPNGASFTARALFNTGPLFLLFSKFFPTDTGPLPKVGITRFAATKTEHGREVIIDFNTDKGEDRSEGFDLLLPFDLEKLKTVQAKFLFLPNAE
jgi:hypothetical protein